MYLRGITRFSKIFLKIFYFDFFDGNIFLASFQVERSQGLSSQNVLKGHYPIFKICLEILYFDFFDGNIFLAPFQVERP